MKSNASATAMINRAKSGIETIRSRVLEDDALERIGDVFALVGRRLEQLVELLPLHDVERILLRLEERADRLAEDRVRLVLDAVDLDALREDRRRIAHVA